MTFQIRDFLIEAMKY